MLVPKPKPQVRPSPIEKSKLLLVEGDTPSHFFEAMARHLKLADEIEIRNFGGIAELPKFLKLLASTVEFQQKVKSVGIARDSEEDPTAAKAAIQSAVQFADLNDDVKVSICLLPDDQTPGMIETLLLRSVAESQVFGCINGFMSCASQNGACIPEGIKQDKNKSQIFLATHQESQMFPGVASYRGVWPFAHDAFKGLRDFMDNL